MVTIKIPLQINPTFKLQKLCGEGVDFLVGVFKAKKQTTMWYKNLSLPTDKSIIFISLSEHQVGHISSKRKTCLEKNRLVFDTRFRCYSIIITRRFQFVSVVAKYQIAFAGNILLFHSHFNTKKNTSLLSWKGFRINRPISDRMFHYSCSFKGTNSYISIPVAFCQQYLSLQTLRLK